MKPKLECNVKVSGSQSLPVAVRTPHRSTLSDHESCQPQLSPGDVVAGERSGSSARAAATESRALGMQKPVPLWLPHLHALGDPAPASQQNMARKLCSALI